MTVWCTTTERTFSARKGPPSHPLLADRQPSVAQLLRGWIAGLGAARLKAVDPSPRPPSTAVVDHGVVGDRRPQRLDSNRADSSVEQTDLHDLCVVADPNRADGGRPTTPLLAGRPSGASSSGVSTSIHSLHTPSLFERIVNVASAPPVSMITISGSLASDRVTGATRCWPVATSRTRSQTW